MIEVGRLTGVVIVLVHRVGDMTHDVDVVETNLNGYWEGEGGFHRG